MSESSQNIPARGVWISLFCVALGSIAFEIFLARYFAIANWAEYGYWVISIAMVGIAVSGVILSLFRGFFTRNREQLFFLIPCFLLLCATAGFHLTTINPFNPLELQNADQWRDQLFNIGKYYLALFPFFFFSGLYIGLNYMTYQHIISRIYATDLLGAGMGGILMLVLMVLLHPFYLLAGVLPLLLLAALLNLPAGRAAIRASFVLMALVLFGVCELWVVKENRADFCVYKPIYAPLHVNNNRVVREIRSPRGYYLLLQNFTEREDVDLSNNYTLLSASGPPRAYGLYKDGFRQTSIPIPGEVGGEHISAALDTIPYQLLRPKKVLLVGARGGSRVREAEALGARSITALEPGDIIHSLVRDELARNVHLSKKRAKVELLRDAPVQYLSRKPQKFDLIDISMDFMGQDDANKYAFTRQALETYYNNLTERGAVSLAVSITELSAYAMKMANTAYLALEHAGVEHPEKHIAVYRSSWNVRILITRRPLGRKMIDKLVALCSDRSFDTSFYPGIKPGDVEVWNQIPSVSFEDEQVDTGAAAGHDAIMEDMLDVFSPARRASLDSNFFNLRPSTADRPSFYSILRLPRLKLILKKIQLIPREEIGFLVNIAVLVQAVLFGVVILLLPLLQRRRIRASGISMPRLILYFAGLGLGFLFIEIVLIEKFTFYLNDRTSAFSLVLSGMLIFSGLGSYLSGNYMKDPVRGLRTAVAVICATVVLYIFILHPIITMTLGWPYLVKFVFIILLTAPLSMAMGMPFPLGLGALGGDRTQFLPWAWSLNGAFSVISTPLANILSVSYGFTGVFLLAVFIYLIVMLTFPVKNAKEFLKNE